MQMFLMTNLIKKDESLGWRVNLPAISSFLPELAQFPLQPQPCSLHLNLIYGTQSDYVDPKDKALHERAFSTISYHPVDAGHWVHSQNFTDFMSTVLQILRED